MAYTTADTLLLGDVQVSASVNKDAFVNDAADEIDAAIGHLYLTPVDITTESTVARHSKVLLKRINMLIATGRLVMALNVGRDDRLHAYGLRMLTEGLAWLQKIVDQEVLLVGAPDPAGNTSSAPPGPVIINADELSAMDAFYYGRMRQPIGSQALLEWAPGEVTSG